MPGITAVIIDGNIKAERLSDWPFVLDRQQAVEIPSDDVLIPLSQLILHLRLRKDFQEADSIREYVASLGIIVECERDRVRFKW